MGYATNMNRVKDRRGGEEKYYWGENSKRFYSDHIVMARWRDKIEYWCMVRRNGEKEGGKGKN